MLSLGIFTSIFIIGAYGQTNNAPRISVGLDGIMLAEDTPIGYKLQLQGTDLDGDSLSWIIQSEYFVLRNGNEAHLIKQLDYETEREIKVNITLSDGKSRTSRTDTLRVVDVNDNPPIFEGASETSTRENERPGTSVYTIRVTDRDQSSELNRVLDVTCVRGDIQMNFEPCDLFRVQLSRKTYREWNGFLTLDRSLNYEVTSHFRIKLSATDGKYITERIIDIRVTDVQDMPPEFISNMQVQIDKDIPAGEHILTVTAVDGDKGVAEKNTITYRLETNPGNLFRIEDTTGRIYTTTYLRDDNQHIIEGSIDFRVQALESQGEGDDAITTQTVTIYFQDINNNGPQWDRPDITVSMKENIVGGIVPGTTLTATDSDLRENAEFEVTIEDGNQAVMRTFEVSPRYGTGFLSVNLRLRDNIILDFDQGPTTYSVNVIARETRTVQRRSAIATITVNVKDVNDNPPIFDKQTYDYYILETAQPYTELVAKPIVTDLDGPRPYGLDTVRYRLQGTERFSVDYLTGQISVKPCDTPGEGVCLDYEVSTEHRFILQAKDSYGEGLLTSANIVVHLRDTNDNKPTFINRNYTTYIEEGQTETDPVIFLNATDPDSFSDIEYSIISGNRNNIWMVDRGNGKISAIRPVDYESNPDGYYRLTVRAYDGKYSDTVDVWIYVRDGNDHAPSFIPNDYYEETISENTNPGTSILRLYTVDQDPVSTPNGQVSYRIESGSQSKFTVETSSGIIRTASGATFDYGITNHCHMTRIRLGPVAF
jgi:hypothetical protein